MVAIAPSVPPCNRAADSVSYFRGICLSRSSYAVPWVLQDWVTVTDLLISLNRLNTFGDDIFKDPKVLQSYYYAITDFSVGGR